MKAKMNAERRTDRRSERRAAEIAAQCFIDTEQLFGNRDVIEIHHHGEVYRLRITKSGKLILNK
jgi:hemin uptake protein HemP